MSEHKSFSLQKRYILILVIFFSAYLTSAVYIDSAARHTIENSQATGQDARVLEGLVSSLSDSLHLLGIAMYQSTLSDTGEQLRVIQDRIVELSKQIDELLSHNTIKQHPEFIEIVLRLESDIRFLTIHAQSLIILQNEVDKKYPAIPIMLGRMQPINQEIIGLIASAIDEAELSSEGVEDSQLVLATLIELRYIWSQVISSVRVFVANRLGAFGPPFETMAVVEKDKKLYTEQLISLFEQLDLYEHQGMLGFVEKEALIQIKSLQKEYETYYKQAAKIYYSKSWRVDRILLKEEVNPVLHSARFNISLLQNRIDALSQAGINQLARNADSLSTFIWVAASISIILMLSAYIGFEYYIRIPIVRVSQALEGEGKGENIQPKITYNTEETDMLVSAFYSMKKQVRSRQLRLESILNNTGEGILTINEDGKIERFNLAAQGLFGYEENEVINRDISLLIPAYSGRHLTAFTRDISLSGEHEAFGLRKNGLSFPMSIRLGETIIEGNVIITALLSDISERKAMIDRLTTLAERDSLTGLYNRHFLMDELERIFDRSGRGEHQTIALLYLDLDNFKYVNDTLGHLAGDMVLQEVTQILEQRARGTDLITRLGGDEFAIILYDVDQKQSQLTADAYRRQLTEYTFRYKGEIVDIGCSIGVAMFDSQILKKEDLLSKADLACHIAKRSGRNRVHVYEARDQENIDLMSAEMGWSRRIKLALENDDFILDSQPIVDTISGRTLSNELLIRLRGKNQKIIMPEGFLASADRFGLAIDLDRWVIENGFKLMASFNQQTFPGLSINLSAKTLGDVSSLMFIKNKMKKYHIDAQKIIFEVTETNAIRSLATAIHFLEQLNEIGFNTSLDDFGAGYSSFVYLKDLPVDYVKFEGSFVQGICTDKVKKAIVIAMNDVAHALGKKTVAEYVEDRATLEALKTIGVDFCQGYYTGRPTAITARQSNVVYL